MATVVYRAPAPDRKHGCLAELDKEFGTMGHRITSGSVVRCSCGQHWALTDRYSWVRVDQFPKES